LSEIDWLGTLLKTFWSRYEMHEDGTYTSHRYPLGEGEAQKFMAGLTDQVGDLYYDLLSEEGASRYETTGEVPIIRDGQTAYRDLDTLILRDLPAVLDTLVVLEAEADERWREEKERKAAERKERNRIRAKERRRLKKLGEW
jgi:hypothetical protein